MTAEQIITNIGNEPATEADREKLISAIIELKRLYKISSNALEKRGWTRDNTPGSKIKESLNTDVLMQKPISDLRNSSLNDLKHVYSIYKNYFGEIVKDEKGNKIFKEYKSSTVKGFKEILKQDEKTLGIKGYATKWTEDDRKKIWKIIDRIKSLGEHELLFAKGFSKDHYFSSGWSIEQIGIYIENEFGKTKLDNINPHKIHDALYKMYEGYAKGRGLTKNLQSFLKK